MYDPIDRKYRRSISLENLQKRANWLSLVTFWFTIPIFRKGKRGYLNEYDLTKPLDSHRASILGERLAISWNREIHRARRHHYAPNLTKIIFKMFMKDIIFHGICLFLVEVPIRLLQPIFLGLLIRYFNPRNQDSTSVHDSTYLRRVLYYWKDQSPVQLEEALVFATGVLLCSVINVVVVHPCLMSAVHTGMKIRIACASLIFRKTLRLDLTRVSGDTIGNIVTLLANDVSRFDMWLLGFHYIWIGPLQMLLCLLLMYKEVGVGAAAGISIMVVFLPLQAWFGNRTSRFRLRTAIKTDERISQMNEIIQGMHVIKMYTWEYAFSRQIHSLRRSEISFIRATSFLKGWAMSLLLITSRTAVFVTVLTGVFVRGGIRTEKFYVIAGFYQILRQTMTSLLPYAISQLAEAHVSITRISNLLFMPECELGDPRVLHPDAEPPRSDPQPKQQESPKIIIRNASVSIDNEICLHNITVSVDKPQLVAVIGHVGSGKSLLLNLILKEIKLYVGSCEVVGRVAYAAQEPWLFSGTVRQNILFGREYDREWYNSVVEACALKPDFSLLPFGDQTTVGERGATLSGGQRARINLARAVYENGDIFLLDDPLSAVDTQVGKHIFEKCIRGLLRDKIVILVTHHIQFISDADKVIIMDQGSMLAEGTYQFLESTKLDFAEFLRNQLSTRDEPEPVGSLVDNIIKKLRRLSTYHMNVIDKRDGRFKPSQGETAAQGSVECSTYRGYFRAGGNYCALFCIFVLFIGTQFLCSTCDFFLAEWVNVEEVRATGGNDSEFVLNALETNDCVTIFAVFMFMIIVVILVRSFYFFIICMRASINLHNRMFKSIITASMQFFTTNTSGEILNRFSKDLGAIDELLPNALIDCFQIMLTLIGSVTVVIIIDYYLALPTLIMVIIFYFLRSYYLKTSIATKRLESKCRSPIFAHLTATIQGLATIRSNKAELVLTEEFDYLVDDHTSAWFMFIATSRAFGYWIDLICVLYIGVIAYSFLIFSTIGSRVGLALVSVIGLTGLFQWGIKQSVEVENQMVPVERVLEYIRIEHEPDLESIPGKKPPPEWPREGKIELRNVSLRYNMESPSVLKSLNLLINPREKVLRRTGAGKSSIITALLRLAYFKGTILIDDIDTSEMGLHDLRRKISVIPQDPVLFSNTLRYNLDPFRHYDDRAVLEALIDVENKIALAEGLNGLSHHIARAGANISVGERQLLCLARAMLRNNRILILDEASANVDLQTDKFIQATIRRKFTHYTVICIAHRLHTIMDYDRVLVIDAGRAVEFDHPYVLLQMTYGLFSSMVANTGPAMAANLKEIARQNYQQKRAQS